VTLADIQSSVKDHLQEVRERLTEILITDFPFVADVADHVVQMRGKLFRPTLLLLCGYMGSDGKKDSALLPMALVVELIHTATLIHDDTIDRATLRRGLQTLNSRWNDQVSIIMGDYLYSRSLTEMVEVGDQDVLKVISNASRRIALGEMKEIRMSGSLDISEEEYFGMIADKTASLMSASCEVGAILGPSEYRSDLRNYGENLGMVFQITDDIADYQGREKVMGKPVGTDIREKKVTLPLIEALRKMSSERQNKFETIFSQDVIDDNDVSTIYEMIEEAGGFDYARKWAVEYGDRAHQNIKDFPDSPFKDALLSCIILIVER
jgi:octaprenyl-diphosphate synthase